MRAWIVDQPGPIGGRPLRQVERSDPAAVPRSDSGTGHRPAGSAGPICTWRREIASRTDHGGRPPAMRSWASSTRSAPAAPASVLGSSRSGPGWGEPTAPVGIAAAVMRTSVLSPTFTGWDVDGGYAGFCCVDERFAYAVPEGLDPVATAPLLCAGIIGYRALLAAQVPPGGRLGIYRVRWKRPPDRPGGR